MQAIEFEATTFKHTIRVPDSVPDGVALRVLLLVDDASMYKQFESIPSMEGKAQNITSQAVEVEEKRRAALAHIAAVQVNWQGEKPIADRDALYDGARR